MDKDMIPHIGKDHIHCQNELGSSLSMALFGCQFKASEYTVAPDAFKDTVKRGNNFRAAAFSLFEGKGQAYIVREFRTGCTEKDAKESVMKQLVPYGTIGNKFPGARLTLSHFHKFDMDSPPCFTAAEILFDSGLLRPGAEEVVAMPGRMEAAVDHYAVLGIDAGSTPEQIKSAFRSAALAHHPDKGGDAGKFDVALRSYEALAGRKEPDAGAILAVVPKAICAEASHADHQAEFERLDSVGRIVALLEEQVV